MAVGDTSNTSNKQTKAMNISPQICNRFTVSDKEPIVGQKVNSLLVKGQTDELPALTNCSPPQISSFVDVVKGYSCRESNVAAQNIPNFDFAHSLATVKRTQEASSSETVTLEPDEDHLLPISELNGNPAVLFPIECKSGLVDKLKYVLVGKFSHGRPIWTKIKQFFHDLKLQGSVNVSIFDYKHIFIECSCKIDFDRLWLNLAWSNDGFIMRMFKWGTDFNPSKESSIVPAWIRMVGIPLHLFDEKSLWQISNIFGKPIKVDPRNINRSMLNHARVCVQLDIAKPLIDTCWVGFIADSMGEIVESYCVKIFYDSLPPFCSVCAHIGHKVESCKRNQPIDSSRTGNLDVVEQETLIHQSKPLDVEQASYAVSKGIQKTGKGHGVIETWQPVVRGDKSVKQISKTKLSTLTVQNRYANRPEVEMVKELNGVKAHCATSKDEAERSTADLNVALSQNRAEPHSTAKHDFRKLQITLTPAKQNTSEVDNPPSSNPNCSNIESPKKDAKRTNKKDKEDQFSEPNDGRAADIVVASDELIDAGKISQQTLQFAESHTANTIDTVVECNLDSAVQALTEQELAVGTCFAANECKDKSNALVVWQEVAASKVCVTPVLQQNSVRHQEQITDATFNSEQDFPMEVQPDDLTKDEDFSTVLQVTHVPVNSIGKEGYSDKIMQQDNGLMNALDDTTVATKEHHFPHGTDVTEMQQKTMDIKTALKSQAIPFSPKQNEQIQRAHKAGSSLAQAPNKKDIEEGQNFNGEGVHLTDYGVLVNSTTLLEVSSAQEWQVVKKNNKAHGVVTRAQAKASNKAGAEQIEEEQIIEQTTPVVSKVQAGNKATQDYQALMKARTRLTNKMDKLFSRLSNINMRDGIRRQLNAEVTALKEEYSLLL